MRSPIFAGKSEHSYKLYFLSIVIFFSAFAKAGIDTIWSVYINGFFQSEGSVGIFTSLLTVFSVASYFFLAPTLRRLPKRKLFIVGSLGMMAGYASYALVRNFVPFIIITILFVFFEAANKIAYGVTLRTHTENSRLGRVEGIKYTLDNLGWIIAPLLCGLIFAHYGVQPVFVIAALFMAIATCIFGFTKADAEERSKIRISFWKNSIDFFRSKERTKAFLINGGKGWWVGFIYIYIPLYILQNNLDNKWIGIILFLFALPLLLEFVVGKLGDKTGFRKLLALGFGALGAASIASFFAGNPYYVLTLIILSSFGLACIEPTREAYFFKITPQADTARFYGPYLTGEDIFSAIGLFISGSTLFYLQFNWIFLITGLAMLCFALLSLTLTERNIT